MSVPQDYLRAIVSYGWRRGIGATTAVWQGTGRGDHFRQHWSCAGSLASKKVTRDPKTNLGPIQWETPPFSKLDPEGAAAVLLRGSSAPNKQSSVAFDPSATAKC
ncbi:unnamed protein product [Heligmosomoides polygyrus]|uniref:SCP domain-containing protein n=1 Tax=Heligmosomoides polygyrus TaxID=6339 RepID=A0A183G2R9_HELPZ|nr:unnamed protein product [Heligmosomoides polygyrus]